MKRYFPLLILCSLLFSCSSSSRLTYNKLPNIMVSQDIDKDGQISKAEAKDYVKTNFAWMDVNKDGFIVMKELNYAVRMTSANGGSRPGGQGQFGGPRGRGGRGGGGFGSRNFNDGFQGGGNGGF